MEVINRLEEQYRGLLAEVLHNGSDKTDRTGVGTKSSFGHNITLYMDHGFPLLGTKKMSLRTIATELKWFLRGDTNIRPLLKDKCRIWTGDAYKVYKRVYDWDLDEYLSVEDFEKRILEDEMFAHTYGELGPIYGRQWRKWKIVDGSFTRYVDQIQELIKEIKENPHSRRLLVNAWNISELHLMTLPPCHYSFQVSIQDDKMSLIWNQRSADLFLGVPFNIASYALLLMLLAKETGYRPYKLVGNFGDVHLYNNHLKQAEEQLSRSFYKLPKVTLLNTDILKGEFDYVLENYNHHAPLKATLNN